MHSTEAKIIGFPGDLSVGAGGTLTFTMEAPCDFVGRRFVIDFLDAATFTSLNCMVRSLRHDNLELVANGRTSLVQNPFPPPVILAIGAPGTLSAATTPNEPYARFNEQFYTGDLFSMTLFNHTATNGIAVAYWITAYGEKCSGKCQ